MSRTTIHPHVLHIIHCLGSGGAARAALELAAHSKLPSTILSLTPAHASLVSEARTRNVAVRDYTGVADLLRQIEAADIVLAHTWNTPELFGLLVGQLPPLRLAIWLHVAGRALPQVVPDAIIQRADAVVATSTPSLSYVLGSTKGPIAPQIILPLRDLSDFFRVVRGRSDRYRVACVGTLDNKLHPNTIAQIAQIDISRLRFTFVGDGPRRAALVREAANCHVAHAIAFRGWTDDMPATLADEDVLAVPMSPTSYASADISIMEAMAAGIPPVILSPEGASDLVTDGIDGVVTRSEAEFVAALSALGDDVQRRRTLGEAARATAMARFDPRHSARSFDDLCLAMLDLPKTGRPAFKFKPPGDCWRHGSGAELACIAYGDGWPALAASLSCDAAVASAADSSISSAPEQALASATGGLIHYLSVHPQDPWLAFWCGLMFSGMGLPLRAAAMFERARLNSFPDADRLDEHSSRATARFRPAAAAPITDDVVRGRNA